MMMGTSGFFPQNCDEPLFKVFARAANQHGSARTWQASMPDRGSARPTPPGGRRDAWKRRACRRGWAMTIQKSHTIFRLTVSDRHNPAILTARAPQLRRRVARQPRPSAPRLTVRVRVGAAIQDDRARAPLNERVPTHSICCLPSRLSG